MKKVATIVAVISILNFFITTESFAQRGISWKGSGGWGPKSTYGRLYNLKTVETITGEVVRVDTLTPISGMSYGVRLMVKSKKETVSIHLGPGWYIEKQDIKIEPKDTIQVKGSRITFQDKPAIIAAEVKKGEDILMLRDEKGIPVWSGWRRR